MATDDVVLIGATNLQQRSRTNASGGVKQRYTVEVSGTTFGINTDPKALAKGPAEAIAEHFRMRITGITQLASKATQKARTAAARAMERGESWASRRYAGGRTGSMAPNQSDRLFNDSGRLAQSLAVGAKEDGWVINVAANRFDPTTFSGGPGALAVMYQKLVELVPEFGDASLLADSLPIRRAIVESTKAMIARADGKASDLRWQIFARGIGLARQIGRLVA